MTRLTSRTITIIAMAFIGGALVLSCFAAAPTDEDAVRATITNYIEGYYTGDASRMEKSLHPHYLKHTISGTDGKLRMTEWTGLQMVQAARSMRGAGRPIINPAVYFRPRRFPSYPAYEPSFGRCA